MSKALRMNEEQRERFAKLYKIVGENAVRQKMAQQGLLKADIDSFVASMADASSSTTTKVTAAPPPPPPPPKTKPASAVSKAPPPPPPPPSAGKLPSASPMVSPPPPVPSKQQQGAPQLDDFDAPPDCPPEAMLSDDLLDYYFGQLKSPAVSDLTVYDVLHDRHESMLPYTRIGSKVMVALQPQMLPNGNADVYYKESTSTPPPHPLSLCEFAYRNMEVLKRDQSIFIRGDKASGKSLIFNEILRFFLQRSEVAKVRESSKGGEWLAGLQASRVILDGFCSVQDAFSSNSSSSRFGQLLTLKFRDVSSSDGAEAAVQLSAAKTTLFAPADRSRLVGSVDSRHLGCFNVFHQLVAGSRQAEYLQSSLMLREGDTYKLTKAMVPSAMSSEGCAEQFNATLDALQSIGFSKETKDETLAILAAILHLGNIDYSRSAADTFEPRGLHKQFSFTTAAALLKVPTAALESYLIDVTAAVGSKIVPGAFSYENASVARSALVTALYESVLSRIMDAMNSLTKANTIEEGASSKLSREAAYHYIHIVHETSPDLDDCTSIDSLFYNYSCDLLHSWYMKEVLHAEQAICIALQISGDAPLSSLETGVDTLSLIAGSSLSVFSLLDLASQQEFPSDARFFEELHGSLEGNPAFGATKNADRRACFCVRHYFAEVRYQNDYGSSQWISLNRNGCDAALDTLYSSSDLSILRSAGLQRSARLQKTGSVSKKTQPSTKISVFLDSLSFLESCVAKTERYSILCIRGAATKAATLDRQLVMSQISSLLIPQAVRALRLNLPISVSFAEFKAPLSALLDPSTSLLTADTDRVLVGCMLQAFGFPVSGYKVGKGVLHLACNQLPLLRRVLRLSLVSSAENKAILSKLLVAFNDHVDELSNLDNVLVQIRECEEEVRVCRNYLKSAGDKCQQLITADAKINSSSVFLAARACMGVVDEKFAAVNTSYKAFVAAHKDDGDRRATVQGVMTEYSKLEETYHTISADHKKVAAVSSDLAAFAQAVARQGEHVDGHVGELLSALRSASMGAQAGLENGDKSSAARSVSEATGLLDDVYIEIDGVMDCIARLTEVGVKKEGLKAEICPNIQKACESLLVYIGNVKTMITASSVSGGTTGVTVILGSGQERLDINLKAFVSRMEMVGEAIALSTAKYASAEQRYDEAFKALQECNRVERTREMLDSCADLLREAEGVRSWVIRDMQQIQSDICSNSYELQSVEETLRTFYSSLDDIEKKLLQCRMRCDESVCIMDFLHLNLNSRQGLGGRDRSRGAAATSGGSEGGDDEGTPSNAGSEQGSGVRIHNYFSLLTFSKVAKERREGFLLKKSTSADAKYYRRWFLLEGGQFSYCCKESDFSKGLAKSILLDKNVFACLAAGGSDKCFELRPGGANSTDGGGALVLKADSADEARSWVIAINSSICRNYVRSGGANGDRFWEIGEQRTSFVRLLEELLPRMLPRPDSPITGRRLFRDEVVEVSQAITCGGFSCFRLSDHRGWLIDESGSALKVVKGTHAPRLARYKYSAAAVGPLLSQNMDITIRDGPSLANAALAHCLQPDSEFEACAQWTARGYSYLKVLDKVRGSGWILEADYKGRIRKVDRSSNVFLLRQAEI